MLRGKYRIPFYMSTDCENLLKRFLVLNPGKRGTLEVRTRQQFVTRQSYSRRGQSDFSRLSLTGCSSVLCKRVDRMFWADRTLICVQEPWRTQGRTVSST